MKNFQYITLIFFLLFAQNSFGQHHEHQTNASNKASQNLGTVEESLKATLNNVLNMYYQLKDALVADNSPLAKQKAGDFLKTLAKVEMNKMTAPQHTFWMKYFEKLRSDAEHINETQDIKHQRDHFSDLSANLWEVLKSFRVNEKPAYQQYCPMEKAYWVSAEKAVKNPYYGKKMLTCGKVNATLE